jgi:serine/threonine protein kinase
MEHPIPCPDEHSLRALVLGKLPEAEADRLHEHLAHCMDCLGTLQRLAEDDLGKEGIDTVLGRLKEQYPSLQSPPAPLQDTEGTHTRDEELPPTAVEELCALLAPPEGSGELGRLGRYHVLGVLGAGGMGVVFEAEDPVLQRRVAIKVIRPALANSASARERFLREARSAAAIENDHVVPVFDVNIDHGVPYLAMPLLRGETLEGRLQREGRLAPAEVIRIGREAAEGLSALHERGLVHRDIKPSNLWLDRERGRVKLLDFGLAQAVEIGPRLTQQGAIVGTPQYLAPEQARGEPVDARTDLFSLGCVLYRSATGRAPFRAGNLMQALRSLELEQPAPPCQVEPEVPAGLSELIVRLLAKDRAYRPESARVVIAALTALDAETPAALPPQSPPPAAAAAASEPTLALPRPRHPRRGVKLLLILLVLLVLLVPGVFLVGSMAGWRPFHGSQVKEEPSVPDPPAPSPGERPPRPRPDFKYTVRSFAGHEAPAGPVAVSEDGKLAISGDFSGHALLWELDSGKVKRNLGGHVGWVWAVALSADNKEILTASNPTRMVTLRAPYRHPGPNVVPGLPVGVGFTPQGAMALLAAGDGQNVLVLWDVRQDMERKRFEGHTDRIHRAMISRDGRRMLSVGLDQTVRLWDVEQGKEIQRFKGHKGPVLAADLARDGSKVVSGGQDGTVRVWDVASGRLLQKLDGKQGAVECVAFSPDGRRVLSGGHDGSLCLWTDLDRPDHHERLKGHTELVGGVAFLPDGQGAFSASADQSVRLWRFSE